MLAALRNVFALAFPPPPMQSRHYQAVAVTDAIDRASLQDLLKRRRKDQTMSENTVIIPQSTRWGTPEYLAQKSSDDAVQRELAAADQAAETSGVAFRDAMRKITELQSAEIERLRAIIADFSAEHPRKPVSIATRTDANGRARGCVALASDGTMWVSDDLLDAPRARWERVADLPQPADIMGAE